MARKTEFELDAVCKSDRGHYVKISTEKHDKSVYIAFHDPIGATIGFIPPKDLERFAVNILKALNSKKLKQ